MTDCATRPDSECNSDTDGRGPSDLQSPPKPWTRLSYPSSGPQKYGTVHLPFTHIPCVPARVLTPPPRTFIYTYKADKPRKCPVCVRARSVLFSFFSSFVFARFISCRSFVVVVFNIDHNGELQLLPLSVSVRRRYHRHATTRSLLTLAHSYPLL